jgi:hypothetical protein
VFVGFCEVMLYLVGTFQTGRNLYPYTRLDRATLFDPDFVNHRAGFTACPVIFLGLTFITRASGTKALS